MKKIAIIGTGIMGNGIAANFLKHGYQVVLWNRSPEKLAGLIAQGGVAASSPKEAVEQADIVFEVTANDESSRAVWLGENGILAGSHSGSTLIASGTFSIVWINELISHCQKNKATFLICP